MKSYRLPFFTSFEDRLRHSQFIGNPFIIKTSGGGISGTSLKAYWKFDESSGTLVNNAGSVTGNSTLGSSADSTTNQNLTYSNTGIISDAIGFNGTTSSSKVVIGSSLSQFNFFHSTTAKFTINFWYKKTSVDTSFRTLIANHYGLSQAGFRIAFNGSNGVQIIGQNESASAFITDTTTGFIPNDTNWHMMTVTFDISLSTDNLEVFIDGVSDHKVTKSAGGTSANSSLALAIGDDQGGDGNFYGLLDEMSIWNRILTGSEITSLYNSGAGLSLY